MRYKHDRNVDFAAVGEYSFAVAGKTGEIFSGRTEKMQNLKKVLALALVFVFAVALVPAASALDFSDSDDIRNTEAVELLTSLGIIEGYSDGTFDPLGNMNRAEAAKILYVSLEGEDDEAKDFASASLFTDVEKGSWAAGYINYAAVMDLVSGSGNGRFRPWDNVTGFEFLKMLLTGLGYDQTIEKFVGTNWDYNVLSVALRCGLTAGFEGDLSKPLSRDDMALLAANAIFASTVEYNDNGRAVATGITFGEEYLGLRTIEGVLVANTEAAIEGASIVKSGSVISVDGKTVTVPAESGRELLGSAVTVLVSVKDGANLTDSEGNFNSNAIAKVFGEIKLDSKNTIELDIDGKETEFAEDVVYYVNYDAVTFEVFDGIGQGHTVKALSNDGDDTVDLVISEKYTYGEVAKVASTGAVTVAGTRYDEKNAIGLEGLEEGDKVVYFTITNGKTVFAEPDVFLGTAEGYTPEYVIIDGEKMQTATGISGFVPGDAPLDVETTYYVFNGMILDCAEQVEEDAPNYALVLRATKIGWQWQAEIIDATGASATYTVANAEDVVVDSAIPFGLYDLTINEDGAAELEVIDLAGHTVESEFEYKNNTPRFGEKFVNTKTVMFLQIEDEWQVFTGMQNIPSFEADASERTVFAVVEDLYSTNDHIALAVIPNVALSDETVEDHFIVMSDVVNIADGKIRFSAWNGSEIVELTSTDTDIAKGGIYTLSINASGVVTEAQEITGVEGILTHAADHVLRLGTAGTADATVITYTKDTKAIIVDFVNGTVESAEISDLSTTAADAVEELEEGTVDTLVIRNDAGEATHIYRIIEE